MFAWWGRTVYRYRLIVIGVMVGLCLFGGFFGMSLGKHVTQSGFYDEGSQSVKASQLADEVYGRDRTSHVVGILTAPDGKRVDDPVWSKTIVDRTCSSMPASSCCVSPRRTFTSGPTSSWHKFEQRYCSSPIHGSRIDVVNEDYPVNSTVRRVGEYGVPFPPAAA